LPSAENAAEALVAAVKAAPSIALCSPRNFIFFTEFFIFMLLLLVTSAESYFWLDEPQLNPLRNGRVIFKPTLSILPGNWNSVYHLLGPL
jgi:hypothetical protein